MKFECLKKDLIKALSITEKIAGTNPTLPILNCVLIEVKNSTVIIRSTNLELGVEVVVPSKITEEGIITVPASILYNTIQNTQDNSVVFETQKEHIVLTTSHSTTTLNTFTSEDFPSLPSIKNGNKYTFNSKELLQGFQSVVYSASTSTIKPELASVCMYEYNKKLFFVSTDSFRLAEKSIQLKQKNSLAQQLLIPIRNAIEVIRILSQLDDNVDMDITINENQISFQFDNVFITSRLIDGTFPDYRQIIPKENISEVVLLKQDVLNVLKKINIFSDKFGQVSISVSPKSKSFTVNARNSTIGETSDSIDAVVKGETVDMRFNFRYMYDCLSSIHSDSVIFYFTGPSKPLIIKGVSDESFLYLVMPMNK